MKEPRDLLRKATLAAAIATVLATTTALTGCFTQSPKPEINTAETSPATADKSETASDSADITITVTPDAETKVETANTSVTNADESATAMDDDTRASAEEDETVAEAAPSDSAEAPSQDNPPEVDTSEVFAKQDAAKEIEDSATAKAATATQTIEQADTNQAETKAQAEGKTVEALTQGETSATTGDDTAAEPKDAEAAVEATSNAITAADDEAETNSLNPEPEQAITDLCDEIGNKLGSVSVEDCLAIELADSGARSRLERSLAVKEYLHNGEEKNGRVLLMGGIHGDEFSSVSIIFKWLKFIEKDQATEFTWQVVPLLNPDGLLRQKSQRQNDAGVDLNRNFPSPDWDADAHHYWQSRTGANPRRFPGPDAASEPETQWFIKTIENFRPDAIVAVHAPHSLVDYDGPQKPPSRLGTLRLHELGIYPGSLGNYAGVYKNIPVVTIELPSAGIMPTRNDINQMWVDLVEWLHREVPKQKLARTEGENNGSDDLPEIDSLH